VGEFPARLESPEDTALQCPKRENDDNDHYQVMHRTSLLLHVGGADSIAERMPDAQDSDVLLVLLDMEDDSVHAPAFAVQQLPGGKAKLFRFSNKGATGRRRAVKRYLDWQFLSCRRLKS
jgi:hypothetical protein